MPIATAATCPDCGQPISPDAPRGMCLPCLRLNVFAPPLMNVGEGAEDLVPLVKFGAWQILRQAGEGAFGLVYEATQDQPVRRKAALKMLKPGLDSREVMSRFALEREALALLDHPGIARVLDAGTEDGRPWFAAEWVDGARSLTAFCQEEKLSLSARIDLFRGICSAIAHAHQRGIIHRDLKPSNLLVDSAGLTKVIDFGIARATNGGLTGSTLVTMAGQVLGTPAYMSPEQAAGHGGEADVRSDLYSLGAVLYEVLTGQPPFPRDLLESQSLQEGLRIICQDDPRRPRAIAPELPAELEWIVLKAIEKDPARRYETASALGRDLAAWQEGSTLLAAPPSRSYRMRVFLRRHRVAAIGAAAVLVTLTAGLLGTTTMYFQARDRAAEAREQSRRATANEAAARANASMGDQQSAQSLFEAGQSTRALLHLARAVLTDPDNTAAATRLLSELVWTDYARPAGPPLTCPEFIRHIQFSPDSSRVAIHSAELNGGFAPGKLLLVDPVTNQPLPNPLPAGVYSAVFSPDSRKIALSLADGTVRFYFTRDGTPAPDKPLVHPIAVRGLTWGTANRLTTLDDANTKSTGRLWELSDPIKPRVISQMPDLQALSAPAWSPDQRHLAWLQMDGTVSVMEARSGRIIQTFKTPGQGMVKFAGNGRLAVQTIQGPLRLYPTNGDLPLTESVRSSALPYNIAVNPDESSLLTLGMDGVTTLWNLPDLSAQHSFRGRWTYASFPRHGSMAALSGDHEAEVLLYDMSRLRPAHPPVPVPGKGVASALSPDGRWLACGGRERQLMIYDIRSFAARPRVISLPSPALWLAWDAGGKWLDTPGANGQMTRWCTGTGQPSLTKTEPIPTLSSSLVGMSWGSGAPGQGRSDERLGYALPPAWREGLTPKDITHGAISTAGSRLILAGKDGTLFSRAIHSPSVPAARKSLPTGLVAMTLSGDGKTCAAALKDGIVLQLETTQLQETGRWSTPPGMVVCLTILPDGRIAAGGTLGRLWISPDSYPDKISGGTIRQLAVTGDGRYLITGDDLNAAGVYDLQTGRAVSPPLVHPGIADRAGILLCPGPDHRVLATAGSHDGTVRLWEIPGGRPLRVLQHSGLVNHFQFSAGGTRLVSVDGVDTTGRVHCWDTATGLPLMPPCILPDSLSGKMLALAPDGSRAAVTSAQMAVCVVDLPPRLNRAPEGLAAFAEARAGWRLSPAGQLETCQGTGLTLPPAVDDPILQAWIRWLQAPPETRLRQPLSGQSTRQYRKALAALKLPGPWTEILQTTPNAALRLTVQAIAANQLPSANSGRHAVSWALRALRQPDADEATLGVAYQIVCYYASWPTRLTAAMTTALRYRTGVVFPIFAASLKEEAENAIDTLASLWNGLQPPTRTPHR